MGHEKKDNQEDTQLINHNEIHSKLPDAILKGKELLAEVKPINLADIKDSCIKQLQRFIADRGQIDNESGTVYLSMMSTLKHHAAAIVRQVKKANDLIIELEKADSVEELENILQEEPTLSEDLDAVIGKCLIITSFAGDYTPGSPS